MARTGLVLAVGFSGFVWVMNGLWSHVAHVIILHAGR